RQRGTVHHLSGSGRPAPGDHEAASWLLSGGRSAAAVLRRRPMTTTYTIRRYHDGRAIGTVALSDEEFARYLAASQQPEGLCRLGSFDGLAEMEPDHEDSGPNVTVYLSEM